MVIRFDVEYGCGVDYYCVLFSYSCGYLWSYFVVEVELFCNLGEVFFWFVGVWLGE